MSILDQAASSHDEALWLVSNQDGTREIVAAHEKNGRGGFAPAWGRPYREILGEFVTSLQRDSLFWLEFQAVYLKTEAMTKGPLGGRPMKAVHFVSGAHTYTAYVGTHHKGGFLGFGGRLATIILADGRAIESNNVWSGRDVPPHLRDVFPDNARIEWK